MGWPAHQHALQQAEDEQQHADDDARPPGAERSIEGNQRLDHAQGQHAEQGAGHGTLAIFGPNRDAYQGLGIALALAIVRSERAGRGTSSVGVLTEGWYLDSLYDALVVKPYFTLARALNAGVESWSLNGAIVGALVWIAHGGNRLLSMTQNGNAARYAGLMVMGGVLMVGYFLWIR